MPPRPTQSSVDPSPLELGLHSQSITSTPPHPVPPSPFSSLGTFRLPLPRFDPLQRFPCLAEPHTPATLPRVTVMLRPQDCDSSRRFAPRATCRACFIPVPLLGFSLRGFDPRAVPYAPLGTPPPSGFRLSSALRLEPARPGFGAHCPEPEPPVLRFSQKSTSVPPWALPSARFLGFSGLQER